MQKHLLTVNDLSVSIEKKPILRGTSLAVQKGEIHALMGPNGSGKSTLAHALMGNPAYHVTVGTIAFAGKNIAKLPTEARARAGMFLSFQEPPEVGGVPLESFLRAVAKKQWELPDVPDPIADAEGRRAQVRAGGQALARVRTALPALNLTDTFLERPLNEGFSGGEKKKCEILQLIALAPRLAILDELDSGLDVDALKAIARVLTKLANEGMSIIAISHYTRLFAALKPHRVHVLKDGAIAASGGRELLRAVDRSGYGAL